MNSMPADSKADLILTVVTVNVLGLMPLISNDSLSNLSAAIVAGRID